MTEISNTDDIIDIRDIIERIEELEAVVSPSDESDGTDNEEREELATLTALLDECKGNGGDHQYHGAWYPITLINDTHFEDYARELAEDTGAIDRDAGWPNNFINWTEAAEALQGDYTSVDFDGETYWVR